MAIPEVRCKGHVPRSQMNRLCTKQPLNKGYCSPKVSATCRSTVFLVSTHSPTHLVSWSSMASVPLHWTPPGISSCDWPLPVYTSVCVWSTRPHSLTSPWGSSNSTSVLIVRRAHSRNGSRIRTLGRVSPWSPTSLIEQSEHRSYSLSSLTLWFCWSLLLALVVLCFWEL